MKKKYEQKPEAKAKKKAYKQRPEVRTKLKAYFKSPEVKEKKQKWFFPEMFYGKHWENIQRSGKTFFFEKNQKPYSVFFHFYKMRIEF